MYNCVVTGSTGLVRRIWLCRATCARLPPPAALLAPRAQRRPALAASTGPLTPHHAIYVRLYLIYLILHMSYSPQHTLHGLFTQTYPICPIERPHASNPKPNASFPQICPLSLTYLAQFGIYTTQDNAIFQSLLIKSLKRRIKKKESNIQLWSHFSFGIFFTKSIY